MIKLSKTYEIIRWPSYEAIDYEEVESGYEFEDLECDDLQDAIETIINHGAVEPSANSVTCDWYSCDPEQDIRTGEITYSAIHIDNATLAELEAIYLAIKEL